MKLLPTISIVVPSLNQAQYLQETLQSLVDQNYPALEVIIQDGMSEDGSVVIAEDFVRSYPDIFQLFVEEGSGQAEALNRGFSRAKGEILAFLNSDDTYFAGALHRVATEIDPGRGRFVIMGRCEFTGECSRYAGVEHPAEYVSHYEQLAIWNRGFSTTPQSAVFWHRVVWERCGGLDVSAHQALGYDLFCRFSRYYPFQLVDELLSTCRLHENSKSSQLSEVELLELSTVISRRYWRSWLWPLRWRCEFSFWLYRQQRTEHARHHARRASEALTRSHYSAVLVEATATLIFSPRMAVQRLVYGWALEKALRVFERVMVLR